MKKVTSTLISLLLCLYVSAQVGALDPYFNASGTPGYVTTQFVTNNDDYGQAIATHSDGRVVVGLYTYNESFTLLRYTTSGTLDASFGSGGVVNLRQSGGDNAVPFAITVLSDNKILVAGFSYPSTKVFALLKLKENGTPDSTFGTNGWTLTPMGSYHAEARSMAVQSNGNIVLAGLSETGSLNSEIYDFAVARFTADGTLDAGFGTGGKVFTPINGNDIAESVAIQSDGKIVVGGTSDADGDANFSVVRYNSDGTIDAGDFGIGGIATVDIAFMGAGSKDLGHALVIQPDGNIILTGQSAPLAGGNNNVATIRLTTDGILDTGFDGDGIANFNNHTVTNTDEGAFAIALQSDGKIIVGGDSNGSGSTFALLLLRYLADGTLDVTFNGDGVADVDISSSQNEFGKAIKLYGNRIYVTAGITEPATTPKDFLLAAIQNDGSPLPLVLSQFYAQKQTSKVVLQWQTTSEENLKQFVIERSSDGKTYKAIGTVAATGNSATTQKYSFADGSPFVSANNYYRLLMQDVDGNYKYSKILIIKFDGQLSTSMQVFPSHVKDILQVQLPNGLQGNISLQIIDMSGRVVKRNSLASDGNALSTTMDVSTLVNGVYVVKAQAGNTFVISRFTKQ